MISPRIQHPTTTTTTTMAAAGGSGLQRWNSPIPYLFGGIALMLGAIALALIILACSYRNSSATSSSSESSNEKSEKHVDSLQAEAEHRIVVIMAGETNPTHLAKPIAAAAARRIQEQV
ncbi:hypothetical protein ABFX02_11G110700 [Erythranthe guttata]